jgi:hypothetical protein
MAAFSESFMFLGTLAVLSIPPTALGLWFLRGNEKAWRFLSYAAPAFSLTAVLAVIINSILNYLKLWDGVWALIDFIGMIRIFATPVMAGAYGVIALIAPNGRARRPLLISMAMELFVTTYTVIYFLLFNRFG